MKSRPQSLSRESALEFLLNWLLAATELRWQRTLSGQHSLQTSKNSFDSLELGDLLPQHFKQHDVHNFRTNFSNSPPNKVSMSSNSTHAGIGFNDLRLLPNARIEKGWHSLHWDSFERLLSDQVIGHCSYAHGQEHISEPHFAGGIHPLGPRGPFHPSRRPCWPWNPPS